MFLDLSTGNFLEFKMWRTRYWRAGFEILTSAEVGNGEKKGAKS